MSTSKLCVQYSGIFHKDRFCRLTESGLKIRVWGKWRWFVTPSRRSQKLLVKWSPAGDTA